MTEISFGHFLLRRLRCLTCNKMDRLGLMPGLCLLSRVRETLDFGARVQGVGIKPIELEGLLAKSSGSSAPSDAEIDAFLKVSHQHRQAILLLARLSKGLAMLCCSKPAKARAK
jgi:hypothetical protein